MRAKVLAVLLAASACALARTSAAAPVDPATATPVQREQASERFKAGKALMDQGKYEQALKELRASLDVVASPTTRLLAARCLVKMGKLVEGYAELGRTSVEGKELATSDPRYEKAAQSAQEERDDLRKKIGLVTINVTHASSDTTLSVAGEQIRRGAWGEPAPVMPGTTSIVLATPGKEPLEQSVTLGAGETKTIDMDAANARTTPSAAGAAVETTPPPKPADAPSDKSRLRPYAYVAGGVGAAGLLVFGIFGSMANSKYDDLKSACGSGPCPASRSSDISAGKTDQTIANVGLVFGIVGVAAGATLFVLSLSKKPAADAPATSLVVGPGALAVRGAF